jgi:hypothetical protein
LSEFGDNPAVPKTVKEACAKLVTSVMDLKRAGENDGAILLVVVTELTAWFARLNEQPTTSPLEPVTDTRNVGIA